MKWLPLYIVALSELHSVHPSSYVPSGLVTGYSFFFSLFFNIYIYIFSSYNRTAFRIAIDFLR